MRERGNQLKEFLSSLLASFSQKEQKIYITLNDSDNDSAKCEWMEKINEKIMWRSHHDEKAQTAGRKIYKINLIVGDVRRKYFILIL